jgi:hypothetical protein
MTSGKTGLKAGQKMDGMQKRINPDDTSIARSFLFLHKGLKEAGQYFLYYQFILYDMYSN